MHSFRTRPRGFASGLHRLPEWQAAVPLYRARTAAGAGLSGNAGEAETDADRYRRSALHFAMGARFPARLPAAGRLSADAASSAGDCADSHGNAQSSSTTFATSWAWISEASFIHGFRRSNIAIEVVETNPSQRPELARELLSDPDHRPAIVYTPSRKQAESVAALLTRDFATAAYHAGLDAERRSRVQDGFPERKAGRDCSDDRVRHGH